MRWTLWFVVLFVACGDSRPPTELPTEESGAGAVADERTSAEEDETTAPNEQAAVSANASNAAGVERRSYPAINALLYGQTLILRERNTEGAPVVLSAHDVLDGRELWRTTRGPEGRQAWLERFDEHHFLARAGDVLELIDVRDGSLRATHTYRGEGRHLWRARGVCLLNTSCSVDVIDCDDARPLKTFRVGISTRRPLDRESARPPPCLGGPSIVGRVGDVLIVSMRNWEEHGQSTSHRQTGADSWVAVHAASGDVVWQAPHACAWCATTHLGVAGSRAWFLNDDGLTLINPRNGRVTRRIARQDARMGLAIQHARPKIQLLFEDSVELIEVPSGRSVLRRDIPASSMAVIAGAEYPPYGRLPVRPQGTGLRFLWLSSEGETLHSEVVPQGSTLQPGIDGSRWIAGPPAATSHGGRPVHHRNFVVSRFHTPESEDGAPNHAHVRHGETLVADISHDAWSMGEAQSDTVEALAIFVHSEAWRTEAEVIVFRAPHDSR